MKKSVTVTQDALGNRKIQFLIFEENNIFVDGEVTFGTVEGKNTLEGRYLVATKIEQIERMFNEIIKENIK